MAWGVQPAPRTLQVGEVSGAIIFGPAVQDSGFPRRVALFVADDEHGTNSRALCANSERTQPLGTATYADPAVGPVAVPFDPLHSRVFEVVGPMAFPMASWTVSENCSQEVDASLALTAAFMSSTVSSAAK